VVDVLVVLVVGSTVDDVLPSDVVVVEVAVVVVPRNPSVVPAVVESTIADGLPSVVVPNVLVVVSAVIDDVVVAKVVAVVVPLSITVVFPSFDVVVLKATVEGEA
jgi:hypothetical protein